MKAPKAHPVGVSRAAFVAARSRWLRWLRWPSAARGACGSGLALGLAGIAACYSAGAGSAPPTNGLYYPVGLAVSNPANPVGGELPGDYLYVANSDFDLQYNGGTLQSYDLRQVRNDAATLIAWNLQSALVAVPAPSTRIPFVFGQQPGSSGDPAPAPRRRSVTDPVMRDNGQRTPLGESCAPPVDSTSTRYIKDHAVIGAFATDLQLGPDGSRLYTPVRGDATLTYANLSGSKILCDQPAGSDRCGQSHLVGNTVDVNDTRMVTMPGEPFGLAQSQDGTALAITQQATQETSLLLSGYEFQSTADTVSPTAPVPVAAATEAPSMQFVLEGVPVGGNGIVAVPHDRDAVTRCEDNGDAFPCVRQAFLETSHSAAVVSLLRYYDDEGSSVHADPSLRRPFLEQEAQFAVSPVNLPGSDQRGIVIDDTPRLKCKAQAALTAGAGPGSDAFQACGQLAARVFIGSRTPPSVVYGEIGGASLASDGTVDPDQVRFKASVPVGDEQGVSRLYLAPIVDPTGHYALRLFVVLFDSATVWVFNPDDHRPEAGTGHRAPRGHPPRPADPGPLRDGLRPLPCTGSRRCERQAGTNGKPTLDSPLDPGAADDDCRRYGALSDVAVSEVAEMLIEQKQPRRSTQSYLVPPDPKVRGPPAFGLRSYRFGYIATFTNSFIQVLDLDDSLLTLPDVTTPSYLGPRSQQTFESIVFTLGNPTPPLGS